MTMCMCFCINWHSYGCDVNAMLLPLWHGVKLGCTLAFWVHKQQDFGVMVVFEILKIWVIITWSYGKIDDTRPCGYKENTPHMWCMHRHVLEKKNTFVCREHIPVYSCEKRNLEIKIIRVTAYDYCNGYFTLKVDNYEEK